MLTDRPGARIAEASGVGYRGHPRGSDGAGEPVTIRDMNLDESIRLWDDITWEI